MTALTWDDIGEKTYQTGIDRGVLYLRDVAGVPWNGLISVDDSPVTDLKSFYLDGAKYLENLAPADFQAKLKAYTYPNEFDSVSGVVSFAPGLSFYEQPPKSFGLTYRTRLGDDVDGIERGYKIHLLYNVLANPDNAAFQTLEESNVNLTEFSWTLTGTPVMLPGIRPAVHIAVDSTTTDPEILASIEAILYGTDSTEPRLPTMAEVAEFFGFIGGLTITDNGDGTWTATDMGDAFFIAFISMIDDTTFQIDNADAIYSDADTYDISSTSAGWT